MSTWMDRPLSVAGRLAVRENGGVATRLVNLDRDALLIPNMPIHFNREVNTGYNFDPQVDMMPVYGGAESAGGLMREIADAAGTEPENILGHDLFLYGRQSASVWGVDDAYFSCGRIDDLECAWACMTALTRSTARDAVNVCAVFDNEEVGSGSRQGADSGFLYDTLTRLGFALGASDGEIRAAVAGSFMVSADNAHAVHPNHPEKFDRQNRAYMNEGVVIKHNANQKYTTDAVSSARFTLVCEQAGVPVQHFVNRSDLPGGSTLGNISNTHVSMDTVDIGLAQLAMHSVYETAGTKDLEYLIKALTAFFC
jgi:aspartyl aminopeptidase